VSRTAAAFLDRDGTIIRDANYVRDPHDVELLPDAAGAIQRLNAAGILVIVVTNQSGIARGYLELDDYRRVEARLNELLAAQGARVDGTYMCPHHPDITGPCDCRKPGLGLYRQAIADHHLDPTRSFFVGDRWRDVAPGRALGGFCVMLDVSSTPPQDRVTARSEAIATATSLSDAVDLFFAAFPRDKRPTRIDSAP
jgi:D-glycero-D-manno-heptose 1,7-bisphosphate phosphatase